jgi:hypothetical protein
MISAKPRRWFRFSLRAMLLIVVVIGVALGWTLHEVRRQGQAVMALEELGCRVTYADGPPTLLEKLRSLCGEMYPRNVIAMTGYWPPATDAAMYYVEELPKLEMVKLDGSRVTDAGLAHLKELPDLRWLSLKGTPVTDAGLANLQGRTQLVVLELGGTQVTDAGVARLAELTELIYLGLNGTQVTDASLVHLRRMTKLECLNAVDTRVTEAGEKGLTDALPNLAVFDSEEKPDSDE